MSEDEFEIGESEWELPEFRLSMKGSKNPKRSARARFNRRKEWAAHALEQLEMAIEVVMSQEGAIYKKGELETLKTAIDAFFKATGQQRPQQAYQLTEDQADAMSIILGSFVTANSAGPSS